MIVQFSCQNTFYNVTLLSIEQRLTHDDVRLNWRIKEGPSRILEWKMSVLELTRTHRSGEDTYPFGAPGLATLVEFHLFNLICHFQSFYSVLGLWFVHGFGMFVFFLFNRHWGFMWCDDKINLFNLISPMDEFCCSCSFLVVLKALTVYFKLRI